MRPSIARLSAVAWLILAACGESAAAVVDDCPQRVAVMREVLKTPYDGEAPPPEVASWVSPIYREFRGTSDPTARARLLDDAVPETIHGCYGIADAFREAGAAPAGARRAAMAKAVPAALESCRCRGVDVETLGFLLRLSPTP